MNKKYCEKHRLAIKKSEHDKYCGHITSYSDNNRLWCDNKCRYVSLYAYLPSSEVSKIQSHFLDGTPCEDYSECDYQNNQTECPKFKPKKWWQIWLKKMVRK